MQHFAFMCWRSVYYFVYFVLSVFHKVLVFNYQNHCLSAFFFSFHFHKYILADDKIYLPFVPYNPRTGKNWKVWGDWGRANTISLTNMISVFHQHDVSNTNMNSVNFLRRRYHFRSVFLFEEAHICLKMIRLSRCLLLLAWDGLSICLIKFLNMIL